MENNPGLSLIKHTSYSPSLPSPGDTPGERLRWARLKKNLTIVELAAQSGSSESTTRGIECNDNAVSSVTIRKLDSVLNQQIWFLGCFENFPFNYISAEN